MESQPLNYQHLRRALAWSIPSELSGSPENSIGRWWADGSEIGQVIKAVDESYQRDNTIIIYLSDHGETKGTMTRWKNCMYEHATRIPLIFRWPKRWNGGQQRLEPVLH